MTHRYVHLFAAVLFATAPSLAQDASSVPLRYGIHLGANYNMAGVGYSDWLQLPQRPGGSFVPFVLNDGSGLGLYAGASAQWQLLDFLGLQTRLSYDNRYLEAVDDQTHKNPDGTFAKDVFLFNNSLVNLEVLAKLYLGNSFHFSGGGGVGIKVDATYDYRLNDQDPTVEGNEIPGAAIVGSAAFGLGYDFWLSQPTEKQQWFITPFVELSYLMGMREVTLESQDGLADGLSVVTIRGGVSVAFGEAEFQSAPPTKHEQVLHGLRT